MQPTFDPATATHVVSETSQQMTLRALGLKTLAEIPQAIPTVKWAWVISGAAVPGERDRREMDYEFMHAAFPSRMDAGRSFTDKGNGKQRADTAYVFLAFFFFAVVRCNAHWVSTSARAESSSSRSSSRSVGEEEPLDLEKEKCRNIEARTLASGLTDGNKQIAGSSSHSPSARGDSPSSKKRKKLKVSSSQQQRYNVTSRKIGIYMRRSRREGRGQCCILRQSGYRRQSECVLLVRCCMNDF